LSAADPICFFFQRKKLLSTSTTFLIDPENREFQVFLKEKKRLKSMISSVFVNLLTKMALQVGRCRNFPEYQFQQQCIG